MTHSDSGTHYAHYDYAVIGCGTIGSMALWQLTEQAPGARILGIERFDRVHTKGSYSGESRLFRVALKEGGIYIPLVQQARRMWLAMNERSGRDIFLPVGAVSVGPADFPTMVQTMAVIEEFGLDHEVLDAAEARADGRVPERVPAGAGGAESEAATASTASAAGTAAEGPSQSEHSTTSEASRPLDGSSQSEDPAPEGSGPSEDSTQGGASGQGEPNPGGASGDSTTDFTLRSSIPRNNDGGSEPKH